MQDKSNIYPELKILSPLEQTWASYRRNPLAMGGLWCFGLLLLITLCLLYTSPSPRDS